MMKRALSVLLAFACLMAFVPCVSLNAAAAEAVPVGYSTQRVITKVGLDGLPDLKNGLQPNVTEYKVTDAEGIEKMAHITNGSHGEVANNFTGITVYLANDIDMTGVEHEPIGVSVTAEADGSNLVYGVTWATSGEKNPSFHGTFDGQGHAIKNWTADTSDSKYRQFGLFGQLAVSVIKNLIIDESCSVKYTSAGGTQVSFVSCYGFWGVTFDNISVRGVMNGVTATYVGGIVSRMQGGGNVIFTNCENRGSMVGIQADHTGGLVGSCDWSGANAAMSFTNCRNAANIENTNFTGGFIAIVSKVRTLTFQNCINNGIIAGFADRTGGFVGSTQSGGLKLTFTDCFNYGESRNKPFVGVATDAISESGCGLSINGSEIQTPISAGTFGTAWGSFTAGEDPTLNATEEDATANIGFNASSVTAQNLAGIKNILLFEEKPNENAYKITTPAGLVKLSELVNNGTKFENVTVYLANDIDMTDIAMAPIGNWTGNANLEAVGETPAYYFGGTFNGLGHIIENLKMINDSNGGFSVTGLFGNAVGITVKNLILGAGCSFVRNGSSYATDCFPVTGAICARAANASFENCWTLASCTGGRVAGGIVGYADGTTSVEACTNSGTVTALQSAGGLIGFSGGELTVKNSRNAGEIAASGGIGEAKGRVAGGIVGRAIAKLKLEGAVNGSAVSGIYYAGGIVGIAEQDYSFSNCYHYGTLMLNTPDPAEILAEKDFLAGKLEGTGTIQDCADRTGKQNPWSPSELTPDYTPDESGPVAPPASDYVGYTSSRVEKVDLSKVPNILSYTTVKSSSYKITTPEGLVYLSELVQNGVTMTGRTIYLGNDIDMQSVTDFVPIGTSLDAYFGGTIDGQGNMIENLHINYKGDGYDLTETEKAVMVGLFGVVADATFQNLILGAGCSVTYSGTANNVNVAGLIGAAVNGGGKTTTVDNCWNQATVIGSIGSVGTVFAGGIMARGDGKVLITNSTNSGNVSGPVSTAGFVVYAGATTIRNSRNTGNVTMTYETGDAWRTAGGFIARPNSNNSCVIEGCINNGTITSPKCAGAFYGAIRVSGCIARNCTNYGEIIARSDSDGSMSGVCGAILPADGWPGAGKPIVSFTQENVVDCFGEVDATLALMETLEPDYTPDPDPAPDDNQTKPGTKPSKPATSEPSNEEESTEEQKQEKDSGCSSAVGFGMLLPLLICVFPFVRRKEDCSN